MITPDYLQELEKALVENANPDTAVKMKKYMKDHFEFFGIPSPLRKELLREHLKTVGHISGNRTEEIAKWCWWAPQREWQYLSMEMLGRQANKADIGLISLYEYLITSKSWWDTVDFIAIHLLGSYFNKFPDQIENITNKWMASGNIWLHRTCILFQLKYKAKTNTGLLENFIEPLTASKEFFIRKAIGWALREYSKTNPDYVIQFVNTHQLSGLSEREALKWMKNKSIIN